MYIVMVNGGQHECDLDHVHDDLHEDELLWHDDHRTDRKNDGNPAGFSSFFPFRRRTDFCITRTIVSITTTLFMLHNIHDLCLHHLRRFYEKN